MTMHEPVIPAYWIKGIATHVGEQDQLVRSALAEADIPPAVLDDPASAITYAQELDFVDALARLTGRPTFGAEVGLAIDPRRTSLLAYLVFNAPTLRYGLGNVARYLRLVRSSARAHLVDEDGVARLVLGNEDPLVHRNRQHAEFVVAATLTALRLATGTALAPVSVEFQHHRGEGQDRVGALLGAPVAFDCPHLVITLRPEVLELAFVDHDVTLLKILEKHADNLLAGQHGLRPSLRHRIERVVLEHLPRDVPSSAAVASILGLSARTLARRLADEGASYQAIVDGVRRRLAESYLDDTALSLAEIAFLLGYADQSSFTTAFKRWTGATPGERRAIATA